MSRRGPVAKARIVVRRDGEDWCLMSRKRSRDARSHGRLEMPGGHVDPGETPLETLRRELAEEELTGRLASCADTSPPPTHRTAMVDGAEHFLFDLRPADLDVDALRHAPDESLGFELVRVADLASGRLDDRLTYRTGLILRAFGPPGRAG